MPCTVGDTPTRAQHQEHEGPAQFGHAGKSVSAAGARRMPDEAETRSSIVCTPYLDAVVACHSPLWQISELYKQGAVDDCKAKWTQLFDCAALRAKPDAEALVRRTACGCRCAHRVPRAATEALSLCLTRRRPSPASPCLAHQARLTAKQAAPCMWHLRTVDEAAAFWSAAFPGNTATD